MRFIILAAAFAAVALVSAQGAAPRTNDQLVAAANNGDADVPVAEELLEFDPPLLKLQETTDAPTKLRVRMRQAPRRSATLYLESGNLKFSACAVKFAPNTYNEWQTVDVRGLPYFTDADRGRQEAVRMRLSCPSGNPSWHGRNWTYPVERPNVKGATCQSNGDPHITTFDGRYYSYQGLGCFYLLKSPALTVQTMTDHWANGATVSVATAIRYGRAHYIVDARETNADNRLVKLTDGEGVDVTRSDDKNEFRFKFPDGSAVTVTYHSGNPRAYLNHQVDVPRCAQGRTGGWCGTYNGKQDDDWTGPDGKPIADMNAFGLSWKVPATDDIFVCKAACPDAPRPAAIQSCDQCRIPETLSGAGIYRDTEGGYQPWNGRRSTYRGARPDWQRPAPRIAVDPAFGARAEKACQDTFNLPEAHRIVSADTYIRSCIADCTTTGTLDTLDAKKEAYLNLVYTHVRPVLALAAQSPAQRSGYARSSEVSKCRNAAQVLGLGSSRCPQNCSNQGTCRKGGCICRPGYTGVACQIRLSAYGRPGASQNTAPVRNNVYDDTDVADDMYEQGPYGDDDEVIYQGRQPSWNARQPSWNARQPSWNARRPTIAHPQTPMYESFDDEADFYNDEA